MRSFKTVERFEDTMIETSVTVEARPAIVDYADILDACEIVPDHDMGAPWNEHDGWDHETRPLISECGDPRGSIYSEELMIVLTEDFSADYRYHCEHGCSKQTAFEMVALAKQKRMDQLVKWWNHGYEWFGVACDFMGHRDSIWGVDDYDYAYRDVRHDVAGEIAAKLESEGYTVTGHPDRSQAHNKLEYHRDRIKRNLRLDCWAD